MASFPDPETRSPDAETRALERYLRRPTRRRLAAVVRACQDHAWSVALRLAGHPEDAADLCQDVFLGLLHRPPAAGSVSSARGWIAARLATVARDRRRGAERRARRELVGAQRIAAEERIEPEELEAVRRAVEELPARLRAVVDLRYFAGLPNREVAEAVGIAEPTVEKDLRRAREILRRRLGKLTGALSILAAGSAARAAAAVPAEIAGRWLHVIDWSPALFPNTAAVLLEAVLVKKTIAAIAAVLLVAACLWYAATPRGDTPSQRLAARPTPPAVIEAKADQPAPATSPAAVDLARPADSQPAPAAADAPSEAAGSLRLKLLWSSDGSPAAGIGVEVWPRWCDNALLCGRAGDTADDGVLVLDGLAPGRYTLRTVLGARIGDRGWIAEFEVAAGEETPLLLRVDDRSTLRGIVVDASDRPVAGAAIWLSAGAFDPIGGDVVAQSQVDGTFELRGVGSQGLYVSARAPGFAPSSQLVIPFRPTGKELRLVLPSAGGAVRGRVLGPDRKPVEGAWALVGARKFLHGSHVAPPPPARARTGADGAFQVEGIAPGRTPIVVRSSLFAPTEAAVEVEEGRTAAVDITLAAGATLNGSVAGEDGRPVARARVRLDGKDGAPGRGEHVPDSDLARMSARTLEDGTFAIEGAPAGEWEVHIDAGDRGQARREVVLAAGEATRLEVSLAAALRLSGSVRYADGSPLVRAMVVIRPGGTTEITDGSGRFAFEGLEDQDYSLRISEPRAQISAIRRNGVRPGPQAVEIVVADSERASGAITGSVVDADGRAVRGANVAGESVDLVGEGQRGVSGSLGGFELERLPAGTYRVRIDAADQPRLWAGEIRVEHGQRVDLGTLTIPRPGFLVTSVTRLDGGPKEAVYYGVVDGDGRNALAVMLSSEPIRRDPLVPGKYRLTVRAPEATEVVRELEIQPGQETRLDVEVAKP